PPTPHHPNAAALAFVPPPPSGQSPPDGTPQIDLMGVGSEPPSLSSVTLVFPSAETIGLVRYLQKLGTNRGAWREVFEPHLVNISVINVSPREDLLVLGREVYRARCAGCHGSTGDGNGPAATFLFPRPRDCTLGVC